MTGRVERRKERDAKASVSESIEEPVRDCTKKQVKPRAYSARASRDQRKRGQPGDGTQRSGEDHRMRETAVAEKIAIPDAEPKAEDVQIGRHRTGRTEEDQTARNRRRRKRARQRCSCHRMANYGRHAAGLSALEPLSARGAVASSRLSLRLLFADELKLCFCLGVVWVCREALLIFLFGLKGIKLSIENYNA